LVATLVFFVIIMLRERFSAAFLATLAIGSKYASAQAYDWKQVKIGGGGGFVPGIVFNPSEQARISHFELRQSKQIELWVCRVLHTHVPILVVPIG
jgi:hypothetical protein